MLASCRAEGSGPLAPGLGLRYRYSRAYLTQQASERGGECALVIPFHRGLQLGIDSGVSLAEAAATFP